jgi:hypothetical protein
MNEGLSPPLIKSFAEHRGVRGVHFYNEQHCEFLRWDEALASIHDRLPEKFADKLVEAVANYDPEGEFVTVTVGGGQITIELFKALSM